MKLKTIITALFLCSISLIANAQRGFNVQSELEAYMEQVRTEEYAKTPNKDLFSKRNAPKLLELVKVYYIDSLPKVRLKAYYLTYKAANEITEKEQKDNAVFVLVNALKDTDSGNVGSVVSWLTDYKKGNFNREAKDSLVSILRTQTFYRDEIIKLVAFVGLAHQVEFIKSNLNNGTYTTTKVKWAAHLALARFGIQENIDFCLDAVKKQGVNDDVIYELVPDLIYTRQKKSFDYVIELLHDKAKNCMSGNPEHAGRIMCGYRIMEYLAPVIKDFPLDVDETGDLEVDDYEKALKKLREWFTVHQSDYRIIRNTY